MERRDSSQDLLLIDIFLEGSIQILVNKFGEDFDYFENFGNGEPSGLLKREAKKAIPALVIPLKE